MSPSASPQLSARAVSKSLGGRVVLDDVSVRVRPGSRIGLLGPNGVGKSTLLRILAGLDEPDAGTVERSPATLTAGLLDQEPEGMAGETLRGFLARRTGVATAIRSLDAAAAAMTEDLGSIQRYTDALERFERLGGHDFMPRAATVAAELGFHDLDVMMAELSGGQRTRAALAAIELARFDVLLLDEPTNDLDAEALERLESFVRGFAGGIVVVSHDRAFLDACVRRFVELDPFTRRASEFAGTWSEYIAERERRRQQQQREHDDAAAERARLQRRATRSGRKPARARGGRGAATSPTGSCGSARSRAHRATAPAPRSSSGGSSASRCPTRRAPGGSCAWTSHRPSAAARWSPASRAPWCGGATSDSGHSTSRSRAVTASRWWVRTARGSRPCCWRSRVTSSSPKAHARWGRASWPACSTSAATRSARARTCARCSRARPGCAARRRARLLATFELGADDVTRPASELSPGERTRAALAVLTARRTNLLLLDEPTNHLDLAAIEELEHALIGYRGTFVLATHDRRLLDTIGVTRTIDLSSKAPTEPRGS